MSRDIWQQTIENRTKAVKSSMVSVVVFNVFQQTALAETRSPVHSGK